MSQLNPSIDQKIILGEELMYFVDRSIEFQLEVLKSVEQDLLAKYRLHAINFDIFSLQTDDPISQIIRASFKHIGETSATKTQTDLDILKDKIKELELELAEQRRLEKMYEGCKGLIEAADNLDLTSLVSNRKRTWDDFSELVRQAESVLELHKELKMERSQGSEEAAEH